MKKSHLSTWGYLLLVFVSGAVVGGFAHRLYMVSPVSSNSSPRSPEQYKRKYMDEMHTRLNLAPDQLKKLDAILEITRHEYEALKPQMTAIQDEQASKVRAMLNDTQRAEYEKMRAEREKRHRNR